MEDDIRPEDVIRIILKDIRKWKSLDNIEENLRKMLWYFEDDRYDDLLDKFKL